MNDCKEIRDVHFETMSCLIFFSLYYFGSLKLHERVLFTGTDSQEQVVIFTQNT